MLSLIAAVTMTAAVTATPAADARPRALFPNSPGGQACQSNGRYQLADPALFYRHNSKAKVSVLGKLPKANHEKAVLRVIDGCAAPLVVGYEVGP